jgi:hypothetical protein
MPAAYLKAASTPTGPIFCSKIRFESRKDAMRGRNGVRKETLGLVKCGSGRLGVYKCPGCGWWHIGHQQGNMRRKRR